jgi:hypothetical protein
MNVNPNWFSRDAQQAAMGFVLSQTSRIETEVYEIQYPDIQYPSLIPVDTSGPEWIKSVTFFSMDKVGQAEFINGGSDSIPLADVSRAKHEEQVYMAGIGYGYSLEEINQAQFLSMNLTSDKASSARRAYEEFVDDLTLNGKSEIGFEGLFNHSNPTAANVAQNAAASSRLWASKTPDEIIADVNDLLSGVHTASKTVEMADTLLIPIERYLSISSTPRSSTSDTTILEYIRRNNVYSALTGQTLDIRGVRGLLTAGAGSTARMVAYRRDPQVLKLHLPMPHRFLPVFQQSPMNFVVPGIFRLGGLEIRRPGAVRYADGF